MLNMWGCTPVRVFIYMYIYVYMCIGSIPHTDPTPLPPPHPHTQHAHTGSKFHLHNPRFTLYPLPKTGHCPMDERPIETLEILRPYLAGVYGLRVGGGE